MAQSEAPSTHASQSAPPTARLSLVRAVGAESCADDRAIIAEVRARLGRDAVVVSADRSIEVFVDRDRGRWRASLVLREAPDRPPARRELTSADPTCAELDAAIALAVALVIDPNGMDRVDAAERSGTTASNTANAPNTTPTRTDNAAARDSATTRATQSPNDHHLAPPRAPIDQWNRGELFSLGAGVSLGSTPVAAIVQLSFEGARRGVVRPFVLVGRTIESRLVDAARSTVTFGFSRTHASVGACFGLANERVSGDLCPVLSVGITTSVLYDTRVLEPVRPGDYPWLAITLSLRGALRIWGPIAFELGASPSLALLRQRFAIEGVAGSVFEQSIVGVDMWAGLRARFW